MKSKTTIKTDRIVSYGNNKNRIIVLFLGGNNGDWKIILAFLTQHRNVANKMLQYTAIGLGGGENTKESREII